jgi:hypothetical protein
VKRERRIPESVRATPQLAAAFDEWQAAVVRLSHLDDVTTELVRLRCARYHDCHT